MSVGAEPSVALETLECIRVVSDDFRVSSVIGLSNVTLGLPERNFFNRAFVSMAVFSGLNAAIMNPNSQDMVETVKAADVLCCRDEYAIKHLEFYREKTRGKVRG